MRFKSPQVSLQLTRGLEGYIRQMRSLAPTGKTENKNQHQAFSADPVRESLTPYEARGLLMRAQIRAPLGR
jgi:hypothetical protein